MPNIKTKPHEWAKAREYFEVGLSLREIWLKTGISKTQLSKRANLENWIKGNEKEQLIQAATEIETKKGQLNGTALEVHLEIVAERTKHLQFFTNAALKNVSVAIKKIDDKTTQADHRLLADTIMKSKEVVLGKAPDTAIQINNTNQGTNATVAQVAAQDLTDEQLLAIARTGLPGAADPEASPE